MGQTHRGMTVGGRGEGGQLRARREASEEPSRWHSDLRLQPLRERARLLAPVCAPVLWQLRQTRAVFLETLFFFKGSWEVSEPPHFIDEETEVLMSKVTHLRLREGSKVGRYS